MNRTGIIGVAATLLLFTGAARLFGDVCGDTLDVTLDFEGGRSFSLKTLSGSVKIEGTDGNEVRIFAVEHARGDGDEAREALEGIEIEIDRRPGRIAVVTHFPGHDGGIFSFLFDRDREHGRTWVDYDIRIPSGVTVVVDGTSADVDVRKVAGELSLDVTSGSVTGRELGGDVRIDGTSGSVDLRGVAGDVVIDNTSGEVLVGDCAGDLEIDKTSGEVTIRRIRGDLSVDGTSSDVTGEDIGGYVEIDLISGDVDLEGVGEGGSFEDVSGDIVVAFRASPERECRISTISGDVELLFGEAGDVDLDLESVSGELEVELEGLQVREMSESSLRAFTGAGNVPVSVETVSGDITIRRR
jgi:DUF4097 and DUF4098 domain-containing protein YvlB